MKNRRQWAQWGRLAVTTSAVVAAFATAAHAAPIGVPSATAGAGKTMIGAEVNVVTDRDLTGGGNAEGESSQFFVKGTLGVDNRLDLDFRLGVGEFKTSPGGDTDLGPAFGAGARVTWASIPDANVKIGSVFQTTRIRAEDGNVRFGWTEYDAALGVSIDVMGPQDPRQRSTQFGLVPYGGLAWSGLDIDGVTAEDDALGLFLGVSAVAQGNFQFGAEVRLVDQTALSVSGGMTF